MNKYRNILIFITFIISFNQYIIPQNWIIFNQSNSEIKSNNIFSIAIDQKNRKWILNDSGLVEIDGNNWTYRKYTPAGFPLWLGKVLKCDLEGNLWVGVGWHDGQVANGGLLEYDGVNWTLYNTSNSSLPDNFIRSILIDSVNNKWILCGDPQPYKPQYIVKFDGKSEWKVFNGAFDTYKNGKIAVIDKDGNIWSADTWNLYKFKDSTYTTIPASYLGTYISALAIDLNNNIWIAGGWGGYAGLTKYKDGVFTFNSYKAVSLLVDSTNLWIGTFEINITDGSLVKYNGTSWKTYTQSNSKLPENFWINDIQKDIFNNLWIGLCPSDSPASGGLVEFREGGIILPVELSSFSAIIVKGNVLLKWQTSTETNNQGFEIQRHSSKDSIWNKLAFVKGKGTSTLINNYSFTDNFYNISFDGNLEYRLKQIDYDGNFHYSNIVQVNVNHLHQYSSLYQNYPNPFNPSTTIKYSLSKTSYVKLCIYNSLGQEVANLISKELNAGVYTTDWNASEFASGIYYYRIVADNFTETKKLLLLK